MHYQSACGRLTRGQRLLSRKPAPLQSSVNAWPRYLHYTRLNSRYCHQDLHHRPRYPGSEKGTTATSLHPSTRHCSRLAIQLSLAQARPRRWYRGTVPPWAARDRQRGARTGLGVIRFWSYRLRQVSCYTRLSGFQPSWPPPCYS